MAEAPGTPAAKLAPKAVLASAVSVTSRRTRTLWADDAPDLVEDVERYLTELEENVGRLIDGADPEPMRDWATSNPLVPPLSRALSRELIRIPLSDSESAEAALTVLQALVGLDVDPLSRTDPHASDSEDLETALRGADAFELLVEVAHDFRSPLTSILFLAEALRDGHSGPLNETQRSQLGLIYSAAFGLASIASDVMDLAREKRGLTEQDTEPFAFSELFASVERMVQPIVEEKGLEFKIVAPERGQSRGHRHALSRVLLNLTTNALKFTEKGTVELGVRPLPHGRLEYYVQDTGRGIPPEKQKALFRPFRPRDGGSKGGHYFSGSGVGLSIARRLLRGMGSELCLDSSDESGTRFSFVLRASPRE